MTTVVAVQGAGWAMVGWDSRAVEEPRTYSVSRASSKVVRNGQFLLGAAGDYRAINLLAHCFAPPKPGELTGNRLDKFVTARFIPALRNLFEEHGYAPVNPLTQATHDSTVLCVVNGTVFVIGEDWSWVRDARGLYAFGSGGDLALGALSVLEVDTIENAKEAILESLRVAARYDMNTDAPFHTTHQLTLH